MQDFQFCWQLMLDVSTFPVMFILFPPYSIVHRSFLGVLISGTGCVERTKQLQAKRAEEKWKASERFLFASRLGKMRRKGRTRTHLRIREDARTGGSFSAMYPLSMRGGGIEVGQLQDWTQVGHMWDKCCDRSEMIGASVGASVVSPMLFGTPRGVVLPCCLDSPRSRGFGLREADFTGANLCRKRWALTGRWLRSKVHRSTWQSGTHQISSHHHKIVLFRPRVREDLISIP